MITALLQSFKNTDPEKADVVVFIFEPADLDAIRHGSPTSLPMTDVFPQLSPDFTVVFDYTPDAEWTQAELTKPGAHFATVVEEGRKRVPVFRVGPHSFIPGRLL